VKNIAAAEGVTVNELDSISGTGKKEELLKRYIRIR
jgi:hypothetical protein